MENTVAFYLYGFGISQLIYGNLSGSFGRKRILIIGIIILAFGVILTYFTQTANMLLISRLIQGLGAGAVAIIPRTIMKDSYKDSKFLRAVTVFMLVLTLTPALAPLVGGAFVTYLPWRLMFLFLFFYVIFISLLAVGVGFLMTNSTAGMLNECSNAVEAGASLSGCVQMIGNGVMINSLSKFQMYSTFYIGIWNLIFGLLMLALVIYLVKIKSHKTIINNTGSS